MFDWNAIITDIHAILKLSPAEIMEESSGGNIYVAFSDPAIFNSPDYEDFQYKAWTVLYGVFGDLYAATDKVWQFKLANLYRGHKAQAFSGVISPFLGIDDTMIVAIKLVNSYAQDVYTILKSLPSTSMLDTVLLPLTEGLGDRPYCNLFPFDTAFAYTSPSGKSLADRYCNLPSAWRKLLLQQLRRISKEYSLSVAEAGELRLVCNSTPDQIEN